MQTEPDIGTAAIDLRKFVNFEPAREPIRYRISGGHESGALVGVIRLIHSDGYEILLRRDDGRVTSHNPYLLFPVIEK